MAGSLAFAQSTLTIASGSVTATRRNHLIAAQTGTADDLDNIATGSVSDFAEMIIRPDAGDTITVKHAATGAGEIHLSDDADFAMSSDMSLFLQRRGTDWYETDRSETLTATQTLMEAASSNIVAVTPGRQHFHPGMAKTWADFDGTGTPAIKSSYNMTSVSNDAVGQWALTIDTDFSSVDYCFVGMCHGVQSNQLDGVLSRDGAVPAAGVLTLDVRNNNGTLGDSAHVCVAMFGDHA